MPGIEFTEADGVGIITISNPDVRNALTREMNAALIEVCAHIASTSGIGAAVVRGASGAFCSGSYRGEWSESSRDPAGDDSFQRLSTVYSAVQAVAELPVPSVAAVRGPAVGAGLNLAMAADLRIVSESAHLAAGFAENGLHPGGGFFVLLGRVAGRESAAAVGLFGASVSGLEARERGMAYECLPDEQVEERALHYARGAAADPELSRAVVASLRDQLGPPAVPWSVAVEADRGKQMWSHGRRGRGMTSEASPDGKATSRH